MVDWYNNMVKPINLEFNTGDTNTEIYVYKYEGISKYLFYILQCKCK